MAATKDKLLYAAIKLFATDGIHRTSIRAIVRAAGVNSQLIYYYFGSKPQLIREAVHLASQQTTYALDKAEAAPTVPEAIRMIVADFTMPSPERALANRLIGQIIMAQDELALEQVHATIDSNARRLKRLIENGVKEGSIRSDIDVTVAAMSIIGLPMWFTMSMPVSRKVGIDYDALGERLYGLLFYGLDHSAAKK